MVISLRKKVYRVLTDVAGEGSHIELDDLDDERLTGLVLSSRFAPMTLSERQDLIWDQFDGRLSLTERSRVVFITADTPEAYEALGGHIPKPPPV